MNLTRKREAFSLMEIMIVVFIIGLLAALAGPRLMKLMFKGQVGAAQGMISGLKNALVEYKMDVGRFPKSLDALIKDVEGAGARWQGPYLEGKAEIPLDPWQNDYVYNRPPKEYPEQYKTFEIISFGGELGPDEPKEKWIPGGS